jgi:hypothetical protein
VETKAQRARDDVRFMTNETGSPEQGGVHAQEGRTKGRTVDPKFLPDGACFKI